MVNKKIVSILMTLMVISILIISGPAQAITLGITDVSNATPDEQSDVSFLAKVDIHTNDVVPLRNITVNIKNADNSVNASCTFLLNGTIISSTPSSNFDVIKLSENIEYNGSFAGYAYGYTSSGYLNQSFGYGYQYALGYGYDNFNDNVGTSAELIYNITWTTPDVNSETTFNIELKTSADDGTHSAVFETKTLTEIKVQADIDTTAPTYSNVGQNNTNPRINEVVSFNTLWSDSGSGTSYSIFSWNDSGSWVNSSPPGMLGGSNSWSNMSEPISASGGTVLGWISYANDTAGNWNNTGIQLFTVANTPLSIVNNITSPDFVYKNTDFNLNLTIIDLDLDSLTGYTQFYVNGTASGSEQSTGSITSGANTLISTLSNTNFNKGDNLIAEFWAGDATVNTSKYNTTQVTVSNSAPVVNVHGTLINATSGGHWFTITSRAQDADGGSDIISTNISSTGSCVYFSNSIDGDYFNETYNCSGAGLASETVSIGFTDSSNDYAQTNPVANVYPNINPTTPTLTNPDNDSYINSITMNWTASSDADGDTVNYYVLVNGTQACSNITDLNCSYDPSDGYYEWSVTPYDGYENGTTSGLRYYTYDTVAPTVNVSSSEGTSTTASTTTISGNATDIGGSGIATVTVNGITATLNASGYYSSPAALSVGSNQITVIAYDNAGNSVTNTSVSVTRTSTSSGGGGSSTSLTTTIPFTTTKTNISLRNNYIIRFVFNRAYHTIKAIRVGTDYVILEIASDPVTITLNLLESKKLDLNNDNYYDLYVKLNEIKIGRAYLTVQSIHEIINPVVTPPAKEELPEEVPEEVPEELPEEVPEEEPKEEVLPEEQIPPEKSKIVILIILITAIIALVAVSFYRIKKGY